MIVVAIILGVFLTIGLIAYSIFQVQLNVHVERNEYDSFYAKWRARTYVWQRGEWYDHLTGREVTWPALKIALNGKKFLIHIEEENQRVLNRKLSGKKDEFYDKEEAY
jgi:hypothetical protein